MNEQDYPLAALCDLYGIDDAEGVVNEAAVDRGSSVVDTLYYLSRNLESYRPNRPGRWLFCRLIGTAMPIAAVMAVIWYLATIGPLNNGLLLWFSFFMFLIFGIFVSVMGIISSADILAKLHHLSLREKEALVRELAKYPYRRRIVAGWFRNHPNIMKFERDAALRLPTVHAKEAVALMRQFEEPERQAKDARVTEQLKGGAL